jgi:WD domain, G-beta repeat
VCADVHVAWASLRRATPPADDHRLHTPACPLSHAVVTCACSRSGGHWRRVCHLKGYHKRTIYSASWCQSAPLIATGAADDCIRIFAESEGSSASSDTPSFDLQTTAAKAHDGDVNCVAWAPPPRDDGGGGGGGGGGPLLLASAGDDCLVKVWRYDPS